MLRPFIIRELCIISRLVHGVSYRTRSYEAEYEREITCARPRSGSALTAANDFGAGATLVMGRGGGGQGPRVVAVRGRAAERPRRE